MKAITKLMCKKNRQHDSITHQIKISFVLILVGIFLASCSSPETKQPFRIGILISGDNRLAPVNGFKDGLKELGYIEGENVFYELFSADGDREKLPALAAEIVGAQPDLVVAGGGIEADALKEATAGTDIPGIFLSVSSSVDRGLVESLRSSSNNFTGIETNDTQLTAKRMELITQLLPGAKHILVFNVPSISPAVESAEVARQTAPGLGLQLTVIDVETQDDVRSALAQLTDAGIDAYLKTPVSPLDNMFSDVLLPTFTEMQIPIMGVGVLDLEKGAFASYAGPRYANGYQAARLADKIFDGTNPADIPVETPKSFEFLISHTMVDHLDLDIPDSIWSLADDVMVVDIDW